MTRMNIRFRKISMSLTTLAASLMLASCGAGDSPGSGITNAPSKSLTIDDQQSAIVHQQHGDVVTSLNTSLDSSTDSSSAPNAYNTNNDDSYSREYQPESEFKPYPTSDAHNTTPNVVTSEIDQDTVTIDDNNTNQQTLATTPNNGNVSSEVDGYPSASSDLNTADYSNNHSTTPHSKHKSGKNSSTTNNIPNSSVTGSTTNAVSPELQPIVTPIPDSSSQGGLSNAQGQDQTIVGESGNSKNTDGVTVVHTNTSDTSSVDNTGNSTSNQEGATGSQDLSIADQETKPIIETPNTADTAIENGATTEVNPPVTTDPPVTVPVDNVRIKKPNVDLEVSKPEAPTFPSPPSAIVSCRNTPAGGDLLVVPCFSSDKPSLGTEQLSSDSNYYSSYQHLNTATIANNSSPINLLDGTSIPTSELYGNGLAVDKPVLATNTAWLPTPVTVFPNFHASLTQARASIRQYTIYGQIPVQFAKIAVENPTNQVSLADIRANGAEIYYGELPLDVVEATRGLSNVNDLQVNRIATGSPNLISNYRTWSLAGLQQQLGTSAYDQNQTPFKVYSLNTTAQFIPTYLGLEYVQHLNLDNYNPLQGKFRDAKIKTQLDVLNANYSLTGQGISVGIVDLLVNKDHPLLADHLNVFVDKQNHHLYDQIARKYTQQTKTAFPYNHGTEVALVLGSTANPIVHDYLGVAPRATINAYEFVLDRTKVADLFKQAQIDGNDIVNASFKFGPRNKSNNVGVIEELRRQAKNWKTAPLYVFATGNRMASGDQTKESGLLNDIILDQYISPIALAVTGVTVDKASYEAGKVGVNTLELSNYAIACGNLASNCLAGFFVNKVSDPTIQDAYTTNPNDHNGLVSDKGAIVRGTSFAAPQISGVAAITKQMFPFMSANNLRQTLLTTAIDLGAPGVDTTYGWGLVNAAKAVRGPAAFAFGDFIVDAKARRLSHLPHTNLYHDWYFTNNIVGTGGLSYYNDTRRKLVLTGNNTYTGATKVLRGELDFYGATSVAPVQVSRHGIFRATNQARVNNLVSNFGFTELNDAQVTNFHNYGTAHLLDAQVNRDLWNTEGSLLVANGNNTIGGDLHLAPKSVFVTNLVSTTHVKGTAYLAGALGLEQTPDYVPEQGLVYKIIDANNFAPTSKRFTASYQQAATDLKLVNYDVIYDDQASDVYVYYHQQSVANLTSAATAYGDFNQPTSQAIAQGMGYIQDVIQVASEQPSSPLALHSEDIYELTPVDKLDPPSESSNQVYHQLMENYFQRFGMAGSNDGIESHSTSYDGNMPASVASAVEIDASGFQPTIATITDNTAKTHEADTADALCNGDSTTHQASTNDITLALASQLEATPVASRVQLTARQQLQLTAATALQQQTGSELVATSLAVSGSNFADSLVVHNFHAQQAMQQLQQSITSQLSTTGWRGTAFTSYTDQSWNPQSSSLTNQFTAKTASVATSYNQAKQHVTAAYSYSKTSWQEAVVPKAIASSVSNAIAHKPYAHATGEAHSLHLGYIHDYDWGRVFAGVGMHHLRLQQQRHIMTQADLTSHLSSNQYDVNASVEAFMLQHRNYDVRATIGLQAAHYHVASFSEQAQQPVAQVFQFSTVGTSYNNLFARLGFSYHQALASLNLPGSIDVTANYLQNLTGNTPSFSDQATARVTADTLFHNNYSWNAGVKLNLPVTTSWQLHLGANYQGSAKTAGYSYHLGLSASF